MIDEAEIRQEVTLRHVRLNVSEDWLTPSGRPRQAPMYEAVVENSYLGQSKVVKGRSVAEVEQKALSQLERWEETEIRRRVSDAKRDARDRAAEMTEEAQQAIEDFRNILNATLGVDDKLDWESMLDHREFEAFEWTSPCSEERVLPASVHDRGSTEVYGRRPWNEQDQTRCRRRSSRFASGSKNGGGPERSARACRRTCGRRRSRWRVSTARGGSLVRCE